MRREGFGVRKGCEWLADGKLVGSKPEVRFPTMTWGGRAKSCKNLGKSCSDSQQMKRLPSRLMQMNSEAYDEA